MNYTVVYTRTYSVDIEADNEDRAVELWEEMDLAPIEFQDSGATVQAVEWHDESGSLNIVEY